MALQLLPKRRAFPNPTLVRLFSSAAESSGDGNDGSRDAFESFFRDVRSALNRSERQSQPEASSFQPLRSRWRSDSPPPPRGAAASGEIHKTLASFRNPSPAAPPPNINTSDGIRKHLSMFKNLKSAAPPRGPPETKTAIGGSAEIPLNVLQSLTEATGTSPRRIYGHQELGEKLRKLRPERRGKDGDWFSLEELSARLTKLSATEEKDSAMEKKDSGYSHLRGALVEADQPKLNTVSALDTMIPSDTPSYMELPPKEHLLETYNHPDNMAAAEKMKIELAKVRDEFKMSESDCGSTRVQVALLTTKIKYLSSVLHKKDKHSRKGLVEMVHKRKRLLKYLRRTDWESYCFVLNKLGLRDVTNYKS